MHFPCPNPECGTQLEASPELAGRQVPCPACRAMATVPSLQDAPTSAHVAASRPGPFAGPAAPTEPGPGPDGPEAPPWPPGKLLLGDFLVERPLGAGGMGEVYLVLCRSSGQRFAAKRVRPKWLRSERHCRLFLGELRTWIDLPEHPNLAACRFFRTFDDLTVVFAEYVEGGSLEEWLRQGRLSGLEQVLDVAIQIAWGLEAAHARGLVHQDVKPGNVLMTPDGVAKVTDFGLAKARTFLESVESGDWAGARSDVTGAFGTRAYQSPEQAALERLTDKTDQWSWGLAVLAMFVGRRKWVSGAEAAEVLEQRLRRVAGGDAAAFRVPMPEAVAETLARCFSRAPEDRWPSMAAAADSLAGAYRTEVRRAYPRERPAVASAAAAPHDRRTTTGVHWTDPREWLRKARCAAGEDPQEAEGPVRARAGSRQAQALDDLIAYEEALAVYSRLVAAGRGDLEPQRAALCMDKALVHEHTGDVPGALALYDQAIEIRQRLVYREGRADLADALARCYLTKAVAAAALGDHGQAVALFGKAIEIRERLVHQEGRRELADELALCYMNMASALGALGDRRQALALYDKAIGIYERLVHQEGRRDRAEGLARCYMNKAVALASLGDNRQAVALYDKVIEIRERLVHQEGRRELADELALCYVNKAVALAALGDLRHAVAFYDLAIGIGQRLVHLEGRSELSNGLAMCYMNKANALCALGDHRQAVALYDEAIGIRQRLVYQEGRGELADDLAKCYMNKANAVRALGENRQAVALYDRAIEIGQRLVHQEGRRELAGGLVLCYTNKAIAVAALGDGPEALSLYDRAIEIQRQRVEEEGRAELAGDLAQLELYWADAARESGRRDEAVQVARRAIETLEAEAQRTGRADLQGALAWARASLADLL